MSQPWTPPSGYNWNDITMLIRQGLGHDMTIPEGDQNKTDANNAINWLGRQLCAFMAAGGGSLTGDTKFTFRHTVQDGWLLCDHRTFGSSASGATLVGDIYEDLFGFIWYFAVDDDLLTSAGAPTTKGVSAAADWAANKRIYLPDAPGRTIVAAGTGTGLTARVLGTKYGAESFTDARTYTITAIPVTGNVRSMTVSFSSMGTVTFPTFDAGTYPTLTPGAFPTFSAGSYPTLNAGAEPTLAAGAFPTLSATGGNISSEPKVGVGLLGAVSCVPKGTEVGADAMGCATLTVDTFSVEITPANIRSALSMSAGTLPSLVLGTLPSLIAGVLPTSSGGTLPSLSAGTLPSSSGGSNAVTGAAATTPVTALAGVTASGATTANALTQALSQPSLVMNLLIKI